MCRLWTVDDDVKVEVYRVVVDEKNLHFELKMVKTIYGERTVTGIERDVKL